MTSDLQKAWINAHQTNINRYRKLLKTHLTDNDREFIERHLVEESAALQTLNRNPANTGITLSDGLRLNRVSQCLSETEVFILECLIHGDSNKVSAHKCQLAEAAVGMHIKSILRKIRALHQADTAIGTTMQTCFSGEPV